MSEQQDGGTRQLVRDLGASTPEILGNVALAIAVLVIIWGLLEALGIDVVGFIQDTVLGG